MNLMVPVHKFLKNKVVNHFIKMIEIQLQNTGKLVSLVSRLSPGCKLFEQEAGQQAYGLDGDWQRHYLTPET